MKWLSRFLIWATVLAIPCYLSMKSYQGALAGAAMSILSLFGFPVRLELRLQEPFNLGIFVSMCMASLRVPMRDRVRALAIGVPVLAVFGLLTVVAVIGGFQLAAARYTMGPDETVTRFLTSTIETIPWISAPALWLLLLGRRELPRRFRHQALRSEP